VKVGDLVEFKNDRFPEPFFIVYKIYRDKKADVVFLASEFGKIGAFHPKELEVVSENR
jgi:hypothetical protein